MKQTLGQDDTFQKNFAEDLKEALKMDFDENDPNLHDKISQKIDEQIKEKKFNGSLDLSKIKSFNFKKEEE